MFYIISIEINLYNVHLLIELSNNYLNVAYGLEAPYEVYRYILKELDEDDLIMLGNRALLNKNRHWFSVYLSTNSTAIIDECDILYSDFTDQEKEIIKSTFINRNLDFKFLEGDKSSIGLSFRLDINKLCYCKCDNI